MNNATSLGKIIHIIITGLFSVTSLAGAVTVTTMSINIKQEYEQQKEKESREKIIEETENISFETIKQQDNTKEEGFSKVIQAGENGIRIKEYLVTYDENGEEVSKTLSYEYIQKDPVYEIISIGTKKPTKTTPVTTPTQRTGSRNNTKDMTRSEYTASGGWEQLVRTMHEQHKNFDWSIYSTHTSWNSSLCYGSIYADHDKKEITGVNWDDQPTPTCDPYRNDHPPLPTKEYLTAYWRSLP